MSERRFDPKKLSKLDSPERRLRTPPEAMVAAVAPHAKMRIADVGAGAGYWILALLDAPESPASIHAIDVSADLLKVLGERVAAHPRGARVTLHEAPGERLPLPDGSVDLVLYGNVFHELDDPKAALAEARRVLSENGRVLIVDWDVPAGAQGDPAFGPPYAHRVPGERVRTMLREAGFSEATSHSGFLDMYALGASPSR